jgi:hypothetical protein
MRFTTITGKAKQYVEDNFVWSTGGKLNENILYLERGKYLYHVPTIRKEFMAYILGYVDKHLEVNDSNKNMVRDVLSSLTWEDVFNSKSAKELLNPPSIPTIKIEPTSPVNQPTQTI